MTDIYRNFAYAENEHKDNMHTNFQGYAAPAFGLGNAGNGFVVQYMLARQDNWKELNDGYKHACLHAALKQEEEESKQETIL